MLEKSENDTVTLENTNLKQQLAESKKMENELRALLEKQSDDERVRTVVENLKLKKQLTDMRMHYSELRLANQKMRN
jgi:hypothetical protein